jgi:hypothetical protein
MKNPLPGIIALILISASLAPVQASESSSAPAAGQPKIFRVVDKDGKVTYTDRPPADRNSVEVELRPITPIPPLQRAEQLSADQAAAAFSGYSRVALISPANDSLVLYDQSQVMVQLDLSPALQPDHLVQFYVDGSPYGKPVAATSRSIAGLERGTHSIAARVLSSQGAVLAMTRPVTVHVQRHFKRNPR